MAMTQDLFLSILAMDSYNRGYNAGLNNLGGIGSQIGDATIAAANSGSNVCAPRLRAAMEAICGLECAIAWAGGKAERSERFLRLNFKIVGISARPPKSQDEEFGRVVIDKIHDPELRPPADPEQLCAIGRARDVEMRPHRGLASQRRQILVEAGHESYRRCFALIIQIFKIFKFISIGLERKFDIKYLVHDVIEALCARYPASISPSLYRTNFPALISRSPSSSDAINSAFSSGVGNSTSTISMTGMSAVSRLGGGGESLFMAIA